MTVPSLQTMLVFEHRERKRTKVEEFFLDNIGRRYSSQLLHERFGSSLRTRISEINRDPAASIVIRNHYCYEPELGREVSVYWSEVRGIAPPERHRDDG